MSKIASDDKSCPLCEKPAREAFRPFCSRRCADLDLSRWLKGVYAIPGGPVEEEDEAGLAQGSAEN